MATTIESLRKLGLKVNGSKPTSDNIGNVINEIADDYQGGSGSAGVSSIGGVDGAITLGTGLSMSGQQLQVSASGGGTQLYKHSVTVSIEDEPGTMQIISLTPTAYTASTVGKDVGVITVLNTFDGENLYIYPLGYMMLTQDGDGLHLAFTLYDAYRSEWQTEVLDPIFVSDIVTAL